MKTMTEKLVKYLNTGKEITSEKITEKFGIVRPSATISRLRDEGLTVYTNYSKAKGYRYRAVEGSL
jgi:biotin operon repressor